MTDQIEQARTFRALHIKGRPIVLFNIWDPGSAAAVAEAGAAAIATGSWPVAVAHGYADGENIPLDLALENARRIAAAVDVPVTIDLEGGYGPEPERVADAVGRLFATGAVGFNFEDQIVGGTGLYPIAEQALRVAAAREACDGAGVPAFVNARTDLFLKAKPTDHDDALLDQAIDRANAYEQAGATGFFAPGLADERLIGRLCEASGLPVNILMRSGVLPKQRLAELGVARISYGPGPYRLAMAALSEAAKAAFA